MRHAVHAVPALGLDLNSAGVMATTGVRDEHYDTVAEALLWMLKTRLGDTFTPDVRDAWVTVYGVLAGTMQAGARAAIAKEAAA
jgi:hemoglobin-like flavoprotein